MKAFSTVGSAKKILTSCAAFLVCLVRVVITLNFLRSARADVLVSPIVKAGRFRYGWLFTGFCLAAANSVSPLRRSVHQAVAFAGGSALPGKSIAATPVKSDPGTFFARCGWRLQVFVDITK
jgi:hypothetical protein